MLSQEYQIKQLKRNVMIRIFWHTFLGLLHLSNTWEDQLFGQPPSLKNYDNYFLDLIKACGSINNHELGLKALREYGYQHYTPVMLPHMQMHSNYVLLCVFSRHLRIYVKLFEYYSLIQATVYGLWKFNMYSKVPIKYT